MFKEKDFNDKSYESYKKYQRTIEKTAQEIEDLSKKYQDNPELIVNDYDEAIKNGLIGIIANVRANGVFRTDIIEDVVTLIRIRKFVVNKYSNCCSNKN